MPYVRDESGSPPRQYSPSPEPTTDGNPGPSKKPRLTPADHQRRQLEKLLQNPEKEVQLPQGAREKTLRAPREMMKNVQGSSAGAGSGEFHVYKQSRRREYERIKIMNDKQRALEEQAAFLARQAERDAIAAAKTAKNRQKRQKRKGKKSDGIAGPGEEALVGRKLANPGGSAMVFRRPDEVEDGSDSEEDQGGEGPGPGLSVGGIGTTGVVGDGDAEIETKFSAPEVLKAAVVEEPKIIVHDDD